MTDKDLINDDEQDTFGVDNKVELIGVYGSDLTHALSAWTSTSRELDKPNKKGVTKRERVPSILNMLATNAHHTPFEKSSLHFLIISDVASHIHILKHRIGVSVNGESARYKELKTDKLYMPQEWPEDEREVYLAHMTESYKKYHRAIKRLTDFYMESENLSKIDARKRAKESARFYLPYGNQLTCDVMFNFRSFAHFIYLRYSTGAQREICDIARKMLLAVKKTDNFNETLKAFKFMDNNGELVGPFE